MALLPQNNIGSNELVCIEYKYYMAICVLLMIAFASFLCFIVVALNKLKQLRERSFLYWYMIHIIHIIHSYVTKLQIDLDHIYIYYNLFIIHLNKGYIFSYIFETEWLSVLSDYDIIFFFFFFNHCFSPFLFSIFFLIVTVFGIFMLYNECPLKLLLLSHTVLIHYNYFALEIKSHSGI